MSLWKNYSGNPRSLGGSNDSAKVVRVLDSIQYNDTRSRRFKDLLQRRVRGLTDNSNHALMRHAAGHSFQHNVVLFSDRYSVLAGKIKNWL